MITIKLSGGLPIVSAESPVASVDRWYDRKSKSWVVQRKDFTGNQIGDAHYCGDKKEAKGMEAAWWKEAGL